MRTIEESSVIEVAIKAGWKVWAKKEKEEQKKIITVYFDKAGTKITFERLGDERPGEVAADMVFVLSQKPHALFERQGSHLLFKTAVRLREALVGGEVRLKTLDERPLKISFKVRVGDIQRGREIDAAACKQGPIKPGHQQTVAGEGMVDSKVRKEQKKETEGLVISTIKRIRLARKAI
jgi:DnaJ-class molecular chaperone